MTATASGYRASPSAPHAKASRRPTVAPPSQEDTLTELRLRPDFTGKHGERRTRLLGEARAAADVREDGHPAPLEGGLKVFRQGSLEFLSNFDSASGELVISDASAKQAMPEDFMERFHIVLRGDPSDGTESTGRKRWFHFGMRAIAPASSAEQTCKVRLVVNNMSSMNDLYNLDGHRPFFRRVPGTSSWRRVPDAGSNFACHPEDVEGSPTVQDEVRCRDEAMLPRIRQLLDNASATSDMPRRRAKSCYIAWDFELELCQESKPVTYYFAFSPPFSYTDLQEYLSRLDALFDDSGYEGKPLPAYMPHIELFGGGSGTLVARGSMARPKKIQITIEHVIAEPSRKMRVWVQKDASLLQVRQAIKAALGLEKLSEVKLVKRLHSNANAFTPLGDTERLNQRTHLLMLGYEFEDGFVAAAPAEPEKEPRETLDMNTTGAMAGMMEAPPQWTPKCGSNVYFHRQRLCLTPQDRRVDLLTISADSPQSAGKVFVEVPPRSFFTTSVSVDGDSPARAFEAEEEDCKRQIVFISARVHPAETPGQFAFLGVLRFLLSDDPRAELLRRQFVFKLVPMLNPDGVVRGHTRANARGLDLNRCYGDANPMDHEGVFWVLEWLKHWAEQGTLLLYLDMHAHAHTRGCILYGNRLPGLAQVWNVAFAKVCQINGPHFDIDGCEFPPMSDKEHGHETNEFSGRASVAALCRLCHAYTLECHYSVGKQARPVQLPKGLQERAVHPGVGVQTSNPVPYGIFEWESVGEAIAVSVLDLHGATPYSRPCCDLRRVLAEASDLIGGTPPAAGSKTPGAEELLAAKPQGIPQRPDLKDTRELQLWRVRHTMVVARESPRLDATVLEVYGRGQLLAVEEEVPGTPWVRLAAPGGFLGGKLNTELRQVSQHQSAYMLTDGSAKGLGQLLERTNMWMRIDLQEMDRKGIAASS